MWRNRSARNAAHAIVLISLLVGFSPTLPVRAGDLAYNDPFGRWSFLLPDAYVHLDDDSPDALHDVYSHTSVFVAPGDRNIDVRYSFGCDTSVSLERYAQEDIDSTIKSTPDVRTNAGSIEQTMLAGRTAVQFDISRVDNNGSDSWAREILAFDGTALYRLYFVAPHTSTSLLQREVDPVIQSFRFFGRGLANGVFTDAAGRFSFTVPPGYHIGPNSPDKSPYPISRTTFYLNVDTSIQLSNIKTQSGISIDTFYDDRSFKEVYDNYAKEGLGLVAASPANQVSSDGIRQISLGSRPAGIFDFYHDLNSSVRYHYIEVFAVSNKTHYLLVFAVSEDDALDANMAARSVLSSFRFLNAG